MENLYYQLNSLPDYLEEITNFSKNACWQWVPFMHLSKEFQNDIGLKITEKDVMLSDLRNSFNGTLRLYMFPNNSVYNWHKDSNIGCSLNLIFDEYNSFTLFNSSNKTGIVDSVTELKYQKNRWYLFNSQVLHSVINMDAKKRFLLTFTFPRVIDYFKVLEFIKKKEY